LRHSVEAMLSPIQRLQQAVVRPSTRHLNAPDVLPTQQRTSLDEATDAYSRAFDQRRRRPSQGQKATTGRQEQYRDSNHPRRPATGGDDLSDRGHRQGAQHGWQYLARAHGDAHVVGRPQACPARDVRLLLVHRAHNASRNGSRSSSSAVSLPFAAQSVIPRCAGARSSRGPGRRRPRGCTDVHAASAKISESTKERLRGQPSRRRPLPHGRYARQTPDPNQYAAAPAGPPRLPRPARGPAALPAVVDVGDRQNPPMTKLSAANAQHRQPWQTGCGNAQLCTRLHAHDRHQ
jgi:hypothetical protein